MMEQALFQLCIDFHGLFMYDSRIKNTSLFGRGAGMKAFVHKHKIFLSLLPVIAIMVLIFCLSAQDDSESSMISGFFVDWFIKLFYWGFDSISQDKQDAILNTVSFFVRKTAHLTLYTFLGLTLFLHFTFLADERKINRPALLAFVIGALYACSDELHQTFVSGRSGELSDVLLDSCGVLLGVLLLWLLFHWRKRKQSQ